MGPFRVCLGPFQVRFGSFSGPFRVRFGPVSGPFRVRFGVLGGVGVGSGRGRGWGRGGVGAGSGWGRGGVGVRGASAREKNITSPELFQNFWLLLFLSVLWWKGVEHLYMCSPPSGLLMWGGVLRHVWYTISS